jgi:hypothetical protein
MAYKNSVDFGKEVLIKPKKPQFEKGNKFDDGKLRWDLLPIIPVETEIRVLMFGAEKYGEWNWKKEMDNKKERWYSATMRHIHAYMKGEILDPESGLPHLAHARCNLSFLMEEYPGFKGM